MKKRAFQVLAAMLTAGVLLTGCGSGSSYDGGSYKSSESASAPAAMNDAAYGVYSSAAEEMTEEKSIDYDGDVESNPDSSLDAEAVTQEPQNASRKLIKTMEYSVETKDLDVLLAGLNKRIEALGGYVESSDVDNDANVYYDYDYDNVGRRRAKREIRERYANFTIRIPQEHLDEFAATVRESSNVVRESLSTQDITLQYVNTDAEREALEEEFASLTAMMKKAETVDEMIQIERALKDVSTELRSIKSQLKTFDNQVTYSTVHLNVHETNEFTQADAGDKPWQQRIAEGFMDSCDDFVYHFQELLVTVFSNLPMILYYIIVIVLLAVIVIAVIKFIIRLAGGKRTKNPKGGRRREHRGHAPSEAAKPYQSGYKRPESLEAAVPFEASKEEQEKPADPDAPTEQV